MAPRYLPAGLRCPRGPAMRGFARTRGGEAGHVGSKHLLGLLRRSFRSSVAASPIDCVHARDDRSQGHVRVVEWPSCDRLRLGQRAGAAAVLHGQVRSQLHAHRRPDPRGARSRRRSCSRSSGSGPTAAARSGCSRQASRSPGSGLGLVGRRAELSRAPRPRLRRRDRHRRVPSGRRQVRGVPERQEARERDVALQHRRQPRATRSGRSSSRRSCSGSASGRAACSPRSPS